MLFSFSLVDQFLFSATTSSYSNGDNFDPSLALFHSDGQIVTFEDPAGSGFVFPAKGVDVDPDAANYDERLALALGPGSYLLALYKYPNGATIDPSTGLDSLLSPFECDLTTACDGVPGGNAFSIAFTTEPLDGGPAPVPEPGTLTLMASGAIAGLIQRRRLKKRNRTEPLSR